jgi:hypothetical protein
MKSKILTGLFIVSVICTSVAKAQEAPQNVVKLNLFALAFTNFSLQYERAFGEKISGALGFTVMPSRGLPSALSSDPTVGKMKISDWSITPEFRWYPGTNKGAPHGFYIAPYLRYSSTSLELPLDFTPSGGLAPRTYNIEGNYSGFGGGVMFGVQWLIKEKVSIDWWILGGHYGTGSASVSIKDDFTVLPPAQRAELKAELDAIEIPAGKISSSITDTEAKIDVTSLPYFGVRSGLTIGYAF